MLYNYDIKKLTIDELPHIMDIGRRAYNISWSKSMMKETILSSNTLVWGVFNTEKSLMLGFAVLSVIIDESDLLMICIDPNNQRKGLGDKILKFIIKQAKQLNIENIFIEVRTSNHPAICLFEKNNFNSIGLRKDYYPPKIGSGREDAIIMSLEC